MLHDLSRAASTLAPTPYDAELQRARAAVLDAVDSRAWQSSGTKDNVQLFTMTSGSVVATKGVAVVAAHPLLIHALFGDTEQRKTWDAMVEEIHVLEHVDRLTQIGYSRFKTVWPVSKRDMHIVGRHERLASTGAYLTYGASIAHPVTAHPPPRGIIRAQLCYYGTLITPLSGGRCRVVFVASSDPRGNLPQWIVGAAAQLQPLNINRVVALGNKPGVREAAERSLMAQIAAAGFDEDEGRFDERTATLAHGVVASSGDEEEAGRAVESDDTQHLPTRGSTVMAA